MSPELNYSSNQTTAIDTRPIDTRPGVNEQTIEWTGPEACETRPSCVPPGINEDTVEWVEDEHLSPSILIEAEKLLDLAGSPELAKEAIDKAALHS